MQKIDAILQEVKEELERATTKFGPFTSSHEGYAVIKEELDELWDEIKTNKRPDTLVRQRAEVIQVAAMAVRFVMDVSDMKEQHQAEEEV